MTSTASQHRCVFVGNIPYDATEEQLVQICEEVGPVVSFRLVIDRETGKPKGYGFCEYKDEETALSARRNLQGYEINGRQLRVDFAENDKGIDRNREQGRGGPGIAANVDSQKQVGGPAIVGDSANQQPIGLSVAMAAASVMAGALGGAQVGIKSNQNGVLGSDPLTLHLAHMSRNQLNDMLSELKVLASQNKELARNLMLASPQLIKALLQALIMLGLVTPQVLQMLNSRQATASLSQSISQSDQQVQQPPLQVYPGLPSIAQNKMHIGVIPSPASAALQNPLVSNQISAPRLQPPHLVQNPSQQTAFPGQSGVLTLPSMHSQQFPSVFAGPQNNLAISSSLKQHMQHPLLQHPGQVGSAHHRHDTQVANVNPTTQHALPIRPPMQDPRLQGAGKPNRVSDSSDTMNRPSKVMKLDDGMSVSMPEAGLNGHNVNLPGTSQVFGLGLSSVNQTPIAKEAPLSEKNVPQLQLPPDVESALLQQVMNLTPEQLSSLPPEQQQQVIQLQKMLR